MNWRELLNPDAHLARAFKLFLLILAVLLLASLLGAFVTHVPSGALLLSIICLSLIAHWLRKRRLPRRERRRQTRGAERIPVLPRIEEEL